ncbi:hypothetical protein D210916BOD24_14730 [Alteromonas sp. D210916BOD_24]
MAWESSGILAKATAKGALFSLYLAMHQHSLAQPISIQGNDNEVAGDDNLQVLNHYRRPALQMADSDWRAIHTLTKLASTDFSGARLFQSLNPTPLAQTDDKLRLSDEIINNCSLGAQKRFFQQYSSRLNEDNTLLYDVLKAQQAAQNSAEKSGLDADDNQYDFQEELGFA